jgi:hypothetical protein
VHKIYGATDSTPALLQEVTKGERKGETKEDMGRLEIEWMMWEWVRKS